MTFGFRTFFKDFHKEKSQINNVKVYANRSVGYLNIEKILKGQEFIKKWKVFIPEAIGSGNMQTDIVKPILGEPNSISTETYIMNGPYSSKTEAKNAVSYIETKFFHFLLGIKKNTQHTSSSFYQFVPLQDFNEPWTDEKLYKKYKLNQDEIDFIESMIRPME